MQKSKLRIFTGVVLVMMFLSGVLFSSMRPVVSSATEDYRLWRQMDPRWGSIYLGDSSETMADSGCLVTCLAILAVHSGARDAESFNPGTFAQELNAINAFSNGAIAKWTSITEVIEEIKFVQKYTFTSTDNAGKAAEMKSFMDQGYYMACKVGWHWVFIDSIIGDTVYMIDPAKDEILLFDAYADKPPSELRVFTGKNPPENTEPNTAPSVTETTETTVTTVPYELGEYYNPNSGYTPIYTEADASSAPLEYLYKGQVVEVTDTAEGFGVIQLGAEIGYVDLSALEFCGAQTAHETGDINNDGAVDGTDLALLNEYLTSLTALPDGISILTIAEINAGDINCDGKTDSSDILKYLAVICD